MLFQSLIFCIVTIPSLTSLPIAGQKCQVRSAAEGPVCGKLSAHEGSSGDRAEAEECREEVFPAGGESDRP